MTIEPESELLSQEFGMIACGSTKKQGGRCMTNQFPWSRSFLGLICALTFLTAAAFVSAASAPKPSAPKRPQPAPAVSVDDCDDESPAVRKAADNARMLVGETRGEEGR